MSSSERPWVLGISASHNGAACLLHGGEVAVAIQEERLLGAKRAYLKGEQSSLAIRYCLDVAGISPAQLSSVVFCQATSPEAPLPRIRANPDLRIDEHGIPLTLISHHLGHACSAYATTPWNDAAILVVDGIGSYETELSEEELSVVRSPVPSGAEIISGYEARGTVLRPVDKHLVAEGRWLGEAGEGMSSFGSLGGMYSAVARQVFGDAMEAGKVMGLAPYGTADIPVAEFFEIVDGEFRFNQAVLERFPRAAAYPADEERNRNLAASVQRALEEALLHLARELRARTTSDRLAFAGGVALNSVANERLVRESDFSDVHIVPAADDSGAALGAAYYGLWRLGHDVVHGPCDDDSLGRRYDGRAVSRAIDRVPYLVEELCDDPLERTAEMLEQGDLVGWFSGRSELGPRALGHRSILSDPRKADGKDVLNSRVKYREGFRPFAPAVLREEVERWFDVSPEHADSPFMLRVMPFRPEVRERVPSVVHVDGTGRVQTVTPNPNAAFYELIRRFHGLTGVPILLNTSFNVRGEPIVETPEDALWCFLFTGLDSCVVEGRILRKAPEFRSPLDLFPRMIDPAPRVEPRAHRSLQAAWETSWGPVRVDVPAAFEHLLTLAQAIPAGGTGWDLMERFSSISGREVTETETIHTLARLRRLHWIRLTPTPASRS